MGFTGGELRKWAPSRMGTVRTELADGYRRIRQAMNDQGDEDSELVCTMLAGVTEAVEQAPPTWLSAATVHGLREAVTGPVRSDLLTAAGSRGLVLFEEPVTQTTLGSAGPTGVSEVDGLAWWAAEFTGHAFDADSPEPNLIVVHALSTNLSTQAPWPPALWAGSTLTDLGMFPLPLGTEFSAPPARIDDLGPAIRLLLGLGLALTEARILFEKVACADAVPPTVGRTVAVLAPA